MSFSVGLTHEFVKMWQHNRKIWLFLIAFVIIPFIFLAVGHLRGPYFIETANRYLEPTVKHPFGTDALGRDMLARTLYATGLSLKVVLQSVALSFILALVLGSIAGYTHGRCPDFVISWIISLLYTVPFILIVVSVFAVIEPGIERAYLVIGCIGWAAPARLVRAEVMQLRTSPFILAEKAFGFSEANILFRSMLPLSFPPALLSLIYYIPELIGIEVGLSFFGLGAQPPIPSLGRLIYDGLSEFYTGWWLTMIPATILFVIMAVIYTFAKMLSRSIKRDIAEGK